MSTPATTKKPILSSTSYDRLKQLCQIGLPAAGTLYFTLAQIWNLPNGEQVLGTLAAINVFLGLLLGYSNRNYNRSDTKYDGTLAVDELADKKVFSLELNGDPEDLAGQNQVIFKVQPK